MDSRFDERKLDEGFRPFGGMFAPVQQTEPKEEVKAPEQPKVETRAPETEDVEQSRVEEEKAKKVYRPRTTDNLKDKTFYKENVSRRVTIVLQPALYDELEKLVSEREQLTYEPISMNKFLTRLITKAIRKGAKDCLD